MRIPRVWMYFAYYSRLSKRPNYLHLPLLLLFAKFDSDYSEGTKAVIRSFHSLRLSEEVQRPNEKLPTIELLCVVAGKDIELLNKSIPAAIFYSNNPISQITVITRSDEVLMCRRILDSLKLKQKIYVVSENEYFDEEQIGNLKAKFKNRYGWVLQQLLAVNFIIKSESAGVLLLNADTTMLRKIDWLYYNESQHILTSLEYHKPYYLLLNQLIQSRIYPKWTYITHHMLFQPKYLREIFHEFQIDNMSYLILWLVKNANEMESSPLCIEFELYGQGMDILHPELLLHRKFANTSWRRTTENFKKRDLILEGRIESPYNSISMHDYLG